MRKISTIYLLRLRHEFRFDGDMYYKEGWRNPNNTSFQKAFTSRDAAITWALNNPPIETNPFNQAGFHAGYPRFYFDYVAGKAEEEETISFESYESLPERTEYIAIRQLEFPQPDDSMIGTMFVQDWLRDIIGVTPPSQDWAEKPEGWVHWWDEGAGGADREQKKEVWRFFVPVPYLLTEVECIG